MAAISSRGRGVNSFRPRQNGRRFADDTFKRIFLYENVRITIKISLKFVPKGPINNNPALVEIMAWRRSGDKPLSKPMMGRLLTHICVTRPQWVKGQVCGPATSISKWFTLTIQGCCAIDQSHKSFNASDKYPTMHHFVTETFVHIVVTKWCIVGYRTGDCGICATGRTKLKPKNDAFLISAYYQLNLMRYIRIRDSISMAWCKTVITPGH